MFSSGRSEVKNSNYRISSGNKAPIYPGVSQVSGDRTSNPSVSTYTNSLYINETAQPTHTDTYSKSAISNLYKYSEPKIDKFSADAYLLNLSVGEELLDLIILEILATCIEIVN